MTKKKTITKREDYIGPVNKPRTEALRDKLYPKPERNEYFKKQYDVHLRQLVVDAEGNAYALGNDERLYRWCKDSCAWVMDLCN